MSKSLESSIKVLKRGKIKGIFSEVKHKNRLKYACTCIYGDFAQNGTTFFN